MASKFHKVIIIINLDKLKIYFIKFMIYSTMQFEWDENKNKINIRKHGISFEEAKKIFNENDKIYLAKEVNDEIRYLISDYIDGKCYSAIFTIRNNKIRIISVRRCRKNEEERI